MPLRLLRAVLVTALAILALPAAALAQTSPYTEGPGSISAYPSPGTISAGPKTQISLRGAPARRLGTITVTGSRSGRHRGRLRAHSDGKGASFVMPRGFRGGERVTVRTGLPIVGTRNGDYSFRVASIPKRVTIQNLILENINAHLVRHFRSRPDLAPPFLHVDTDTGQTAPGLLFLSPKSKKDQKQAGPMIADNTGQPVWFQPLPGVEAATDFRTQTYKGKPVLTYWQGTSRQGIGVGEMIVRDQNYRVIRRIRTANGFRPDLHEFTITPQGTAILITYPVVRTDLRKVGGARHGLAVDSVIQEIDLDTGLVEFEWHSLGKIGLTETFSKPQPSPRNPFDYAHANAVDLDSDGDFLLSARNTWTIYKIDRATGSIRWRLGGKKSTFKLPADARFAWQHDVRRRSDGAITLFDNEAFPPIRKFSRAIALRLDERNKTASLIGSLVHPRHLLTATQGDQQSLPNGDTVVGWGSQRYLTEFGPAGNVVFDAFLSLGFESYRAYRLPWVGLPLTPPRVAAADEPGAGTDVYSSWNGATEVASWEIFAGSTATSLKSVASAPRTGFETKITVPGRPRFVAARAKDAAGRTLSTTAPTRVTAG
jgi:Arylsulfotransferase (ASST)